MLSVGWSAYFVECRVALIICVAKIEAEGTKPLERGEVSLQCRPVDGCAAPVVDCLPVAAVIHQPTADLKPCLAEGDKQSQNENQNALEIR